MGSYYDMQQISKLSTFTAPMAINVCLWETNDDNSFETKSVSVVMGSDGHWVGKSLLYVGYMVGVIF